MSNNVRRQAFSAAAAALRLISSTADGVLQYHSSDARIPSSADTASGGETKNDGPGRIQAVLVIQASHRGRMARKLAVEVEQAAAAVRVAATVKV